MTHTTTHQTACLPTKSRQAGFFAVLGKMIAFTRQRRALGNLDDHLLSDIGVSRHQAQTEAKRPVWDVPGIWLK